MPETKPSEERPLRFILPKKGRLKEDLKAVLAGTNLDFQKENDRHDYGYFYDRKGALEVFEGLTQRPGDALTKLSKGVAELAIVGLDKFVEVRSAAQEEGRTLNCEVTDSFNMSACALYIAAPENANITEPADLSGKTIATSYPATLRRWLADNGVCNANVEYAEGGIEDYVRLGLADAVMDVVDSGRTLEANGLQKCMKLYDSTAVLVRRTGEWSAEAFGTAEQIRARFVKAANEKSAGSNPARNEPEPAAPELQQAPVAAFA